MIYLIFLLLAFIQAEPPEDGIVFTVYSPVEGQCDSSPLITADNSRIDLASLRSGDIRWCAVSRDLLDRYSYGDRIDVFICDGHPKNGIWEIHDTMNKRYSKTVDFLTYNEKYGKWKGTIRKL